YREALRRDPADIRNNNALGLLLLKRGQFSKAETLFRSAIRTQIRHNPNPQDGEPYYNLGVCLRFLGKTQEAYEAFFKATWNAAWQDGAFFQLAQLVASRAYSDRIPTAQRVRRRHGAKNSLARDHASLIQALEFVESSLARNAHNQKATHL